MKRNVFLHLVSNIVLIVVVVGVVGVGFFGNATSVFSNQDLQPIYRGNGQNKVSLMFNVYMGTEYIDKILSILNKYNATATFFVGGCWVAKNADVLLKISNSGHEIGNHGYFHKTHSKLTYQQNLTEIETCGKLIKECIGSGVRLFAPPSGDFSQDTLKAACQLGYKTIMWSKDTIDWRDKDSNLIFERATKNIKSGDFVLMHPTLQTVNALEKILSYYVKNNFEVVAVSENLGELWTFSNNIQADLG